MSVFIRQIASLQSSVQSAELEKLQEENNELRAEVVRWTGTLVKAEEQNGVQQVGALVIIATAKHSLLFIFHNAVNFF